jgi:KDO2-lipid IV(A) lauroyltransferase
VRGIRRGRSSRFDVTFDAPLIPESGDTAALDTMREVNLRLESWIRETPEQYFWLHNRWRQ